jgi:hypothetical protein
MNQAFLDYFRCPEDFADFRLDDVQPRTNTPGYFCFGHDVVCFGTAGVPVQHEMGGPLADVYAQVRSKEGATYLSFNPTDVADNLRNERYVNGVQSSTWRTLARAAYYLIRPALPVSARRPLQRVWLKSWNKKPFPRWPVDVTVDRMFERLMACLLLSRPGSRIPFVWFWPEGKSSCAIVTHDVETASGLEFIGKLMDINDSFGIKSSFQIIPESRYSTGESILAEMRARGFEINVHDLTHDGHLYDDHERFRESAAKINQYAQRFRSNGFRSGVLYRNLNWYDSLSFSYDMSVPNVGHLDPQPGGCCTVMPYFIGKVLELPLTTTQDYSLFNILWTHSIDLWREQINHVMRQHGLISFNVHPDYLNTPEARGAYTALLKHLTELRTDAGVWTALPGQVDIWWRQRSQMKISPDGLGWCIQGPGAERAKLAYATLNNDSVTYSFN